MSECDFLEFVHPPIVGAAVAVDVVGVVVRRENTAENTSANTAVAAAVVVVGNKIENINCSQETVSASAVAY